MKLIEEIKEHLNYIKFIDSLRNGTAKLDWQWETDIKKMDFSKLRSRISVDPDQELMILKLEDIHAPDNREQFFRDPATKNLVHFIEQGNKIIPPVGAFSSIIEDGEKVSECFYSSDGAHRVNLAYLLGKKEIPVLAKKIVSQYSFTLGQWVFEEVNKMIIAKGKTTVEFIAENYLLDSDVEKITFWVRH